MNKFLMIFSISVIVGLAQGQNEYGNLIASNIGVYNLQVYDSGTINCDNFICPSNTHKCIIDKVSKTDATVTTRFCVDANNKILDKQELSVPNHPSDQSYRRSHAEADVTGRVVVNNQEYDSNNYNYQSASSSNALSPEDFQKIQKMQQDVREYTNKLREDINNRVQESLSKIREMQFNF